MAKRNIRINPDEFKLENFINYYNENVRGKLLWKKMYLKKLQKLMLL